MHCTLGVQQFFRRRDRRDRDPSSSGTLSGRLCIHHDFLAFLENHDSRDHLIFGDLDGRAAVRRLVLRRLYLEVLDLDLTARKRRDAADVEPSVIAMKFAVETSPHMLLAHMADFHADAETAFNLPTGVGRFKHSRKSVHMLISPFAGLFDVKDGLLNVEQLTTENREPLCCPLTQLLRAFGQ